MKKMLLLFFPLLLYAHPTPVDTITLRISVIDGDASFEGPGRLDENGIDTVLTPIPKPYQGAHIYIQAKQPQDTLFQIIGETITDSTGQATIQVNLTNIQEDHDTKNYLLIPTRKGLYISNTGTKPLEIELFDVSGRKRLEGIVELGTREKIDIEKEGIYMLKIGEKETIKVANISGKILISTQPTYNNHITSITDNPTIPDTNFRLIVVDSTYEKGIIYYPYGSEETPHDTTIHIAIFSNEQRVFGGTRVGITDRNKFIDLWSNDGLQYVYDAHQTPEWLYPYRDENLDSLIFPLTLYVMYSDEATRRRQWPTDSSFIYNFYGRGRNSINYGTGLLLVGEIVDTNRILSPDELALRGIGIMHGSGNYTVREPYYPMWSIVNDWQETAVMIIADVCAIQGESKFLGQTETGYPSIYNQGHPSANLDIDWANIRIGWKWSILYRLGLTDAFIAGVVWGSDNINRALQGVSLPGN